MSIRQIFNLLTSALGENEKTITVPEGWTAKDIGFYFENQGMFMAEEVLEVTGFPPSPGYAPMAGLDFGGEFDFLKDKSRAVGLEGYLFPDTYRIYNNASVKDIVRKMLANFNRKLTPQMRADIAKNQMTIFDTVILASILEKELKTYDDKRNAASVFYKRLNANMALQADSTINYVTGKKNVSVSAEDLKLDSSLTLTNTAACRGPICNPGLDAIKAAIYPEKNDYWYFLTDKNGQAHFAKTLEEHGENRIKYLK